MPPLMRRTKNGIQTDLVPGIAAAAAFLGLVFFLAFNPLLSAFLAGGVYFGLWLVLRRPETPALPEVNDSETIRQIYAIVPQVGNPAIQARITEICQKADSIRQYLEEEPEKAALWQGLFREYLDSTLKMVRGYAELSRHADPSEAPALQQFEGMLGQIGQTFSGLKRKMVEQDAEAFAAEMQSYQSQLQAMDEVASIRLGGDQG